MPYDRSYERAPTRVPLDPWGLPPSSASRRDTEDMLSRVSRTEAESSEAYRRIEEHLRTVARRLDSAERSQSENNRAMNKTATEINIATREQAQAFDQLGGHVMSIGDRLERLERGPAQDGLKDAVKALHQGLSRLADQITQTATQSAQQVTAISGNLEQMAGRLGQVRTDVEGTARRLEARVAAVEEEPATVSPPLRRKPRAPWISAWRRWKKPRTSIPMRWIMRWSGWKPRPASAPATRPNCRSAMPKPTAPSAAWKKVSERLEAAECRSGDGTAAGQHRARSGHPGQPAGNL